MDFELTPEQRVIAESAAEVLARAAGPAAPGRAGPDASWEGLAKAGLLALTLPGWLGGDDLGVMEAAVLLTEIGRRAAGVPALATIMLGALPVTRWGTRELQRQLLPGVGSGEVVLTAGVRERSAGMAAEPATVLALAPDGASGSVTGTKVGVPFAGEAAWILVPATVVGQGRAVAIVDAAGPGVALRRTPAAGEAPEYTVRLDGAPAAGVLGSGAAGRDEAVGDLYLLAAAGAACVADGALAGALDLTARYVATREQFGRPLAAFQAVAQQIADVYITGRTLHLAALSACWRLAAGLDAGEDAGVAAYWLAAEVPAALRTCHHLHGGIGMDIGYPLHRYSALAGDLARFVGGADYRLGLLAAAADAGTRATGQAP